MGCVLGLGNTLQQLCYACTKTLSEEQLCTLALCAGEWGGNTLEKCESPETVLDCMEEGGKKDSLEFDQGTDGPCLVRAMSSSLENNTHKRLRDTFIVNFWTTKLLLDLSLRGF